MAKQARLAVALLAALLVGMPAAGQDNLTAQVDELFAGYNRTDSPGCALGVIRDGQLVYARGYGMASLELGVPIGSHTVFYIGSTSKQFVAASIVLAAKQGHLSLDDDIRTHLPEIPDYGPPVTIRHMIHHTSGLRDYLTLMALAGLPYENLYTNDELVELVARQKELNFAPGAEYLYSNSGYFLLAQIIKRATGLSLREFARQNIFQPLGMRNTHFHDDSRMVVPNRAMAYSPAEGGGFELEWYNNFDKVGSGGLLTTVEDLLLWDRNFYDDKLGDVGLVEQMLVRGVLNEGKELDYAFGLQHGEYRGLRTVAHGGSFMGFRAQLLRFPEQRFSVAVLCNLGSTNPSRLARRVAAVYLAEKLQPVPEEAGRERPSGRQGSGDTVALTAAELEAYAGSYYSEELRATYRLMVQEGALTAQVGRRPRRSLTAVEDDMFRAGFLRVEFGRDASGKIESFTIQAGRVRNIRFTRTED